MDEKMTGTRSVTYCKGHGWQILAGTYLEPDVPEKCPNCVVKIRPTSAANRQS